MSETICYCDPDFICHHCVEAEYQAELEAECQAWNEYFASHPQLSEEELPF